MYEETADSVVGMLNGSPVVVCFESSPMRILSVITKLADGRWAHAEPGDGTIEFLNRDVPNCSRWCFGFIVTRLRALGWTVDAYATYTQKVNDAALFSLSGPFWDDLSEKAGAIA